MLGKPEVGAELGDHPGQQPGDLGLGEPELDGDRLLRLVLTEPEPQQHTISYR